MGWPWHGLAAVAQACTRHILRQSIPRGRINSGHGRELWNGICFSNARDGTHRWAGRRFHASNVGVQHIIFQNLTLVMANKKILIVDDSPVILAALSLKLKAN